MRDPRTSLALLLAVSALALILDGTSALACVATGSLAWLLPTLPEPAWRRRVALISVAIVWSTMLSQGLFYATHPRVPLLQLGPVTIWREGVLHGLVQSLRLLAVAYAGAAVALRIPTDRLLMALRTLGVPLGLALMVATAIRFVPLLGEEMRIVRAARRARGGVGDARRPLATLQGEWDSLRPVIARSIRRARTLGRALDSRGYSADAVRTSRRALSMPAAERLLLAGLGVAVAGVATAKGLMLLYVTDTLYIPALRGLYSAVRGWL